MLLYLKDLNSNSEVKLDLEVESSVSTSDVFVIFISLQTTWELINGKTSSEFDEFYIKKLSHIIYTKTVYEGVRYILTLGFYFTGSNISYFIIEEKSDVDLIRFANSGYCENDYYTFHKLFN